MIALRRRHGHTPRPPAGIRAASPRRPRMFAKGTSLVRRARRGGTINGWVSGQLRRSGWLTRRCRKKERMKRAGSRTGGGPGDFRLNDDGGRQDAPYYRHGNGRLGRPAAVSAETGGATPMAREAVAVMAAHLLDVHRAGGGTVRPA